MGEGVGRRFASFDKGNGAPGPASSHHLIGQGSRLDVAPMPSISRLRAYPLGVRWWYSAIVREDYGRTWPAYRPNVFYHRLTMLCEINARLGKYLGKRYMDPGY